MVTRKWLAFAALLLPAACNSILGIDAPNHVAMDAGDSEAGEPDASNTDASIADASIADATITDAPIPDATVPIGDSSANDASPDANRGPAVFDGSCACSGDACAPFVLAANQEGLGHFIAAGPEGVYWSTYTSASGTISATMFDGGSGVLALDAIPQNIVYEHNALFWSSASQAALKTCDLPGCVAPRTFFYPATSGNDLVADGQNLYFLTGKSIGECPPAGCPEAGAVFVADSGTPQLVAVGNGQLAWSDATTIWSCALPGCSTLNTLTTGEAIIALAVDATHAYWLTLGDMLRTCPIASCDADKATIASNLVQPGRLVVDAKAIYWTSLGGGATLGKVQKVPLSGGAVVTLADEQPSPSGLAVGDSCLFWTNTLSADGGSAGSVQAIAK